MKSPKLRRESNLPTANTKKPNCALESASEWARGARLRLHESGTRFKRQQLDASIPGRLLSRHSFPHGRGDRSCRDTQPIQRRARAIRRNPRNAAGVLCGGLLWRSMSASSKAAEIRNQASARVREHRPKTLSRFRYPITLDWIQLTSVPPAMKNY